ncbi:50S ribosome-binding GTPase family protein [Cryptosporidium meleagridis]|uniref:50S ribosome-binding GTPase family protein n=1 Tax=Cryptosporidium meleagridis TaxID=93969 RepID=A0A2P4Z177_9CRYT|nr:50S ribosome-binding GTPase family protein [Cryptosporidium meleagridis]
MGGGGKKFISKKKGINQGQLGKAIWNSSQKKFESISNDKEHLLDVICDNYNKLNNKSIIEMTDLDEYLSTSLRAQENFEEEKVIKIISPQEINASNRNLLLKKEKMLDGKVINLPIPRRPMILVGPNCKAKKAPNMEYLDNLEKEAFLTWRKSIADEEELVGLFVTPFEKNLEFWRQLWRTIERSHVVVEIIDSRDPLFFRNIDLERYINEIDPLKKVVLLFNKADFLTLELREQWIQYFKDNAPNLKVYFFSALNEINKRERLESYIPEDFNLKNINDTDVLSTHQLMYKLYELASEVFQATKQRYLNQKECNDEEINKTTISTIQNDDTKNCENSNSSDEEVDSKKEEDDEEEDEDFEDGESDENEEFKEDKDFEVDENMPNSILKNKSKVKTYSEIFNRVKLDPLNPGELTIGMVGFPNVGKSSIVNALFGSQKSSISRTPGKTKHLQTLRLKPPHLNDKDEVQSLITLCDCPGLVMPSFTSTKEHLLINGVTPIDHFRGNFLDTIQVIGERITAQLYKTYFDGIDYQVPRIFNSAQFLNKLCETRHLFQQGKGAIPDWSKAGRMILRDYWSGKLLYCHTPPSITKNTIGSDPNKLAGSLDKVTIHDSDEDSDDDIAMLKSSVLNNGIINPSDKEKKKTKRQIRMENKKLIKGRTVCYS